MKKTLFFLLTLLPFFSFGQYAEVGIFGGLSYYQGDLSPSSVVIKESYPAFGAFLRYNPHNFVSFKLGLNYGQVSGNDANSNNEEIQNRNLSFRSNIFEASVQGEFNLLGYQPYGLEKIISPYLFVGVGAFHYSPKTTYEGEWVPLQPLGTEGQGISANAPKYSKMAIAVPLGIGMKFAVNDHWNLGLEFGFRKTFTDHLDDVSGAYVPYQEFIDAYGPEQGMYIANLSNRSGSDKLEGELRGNPDNTDWYLLAGLTVSYNFIDNGLAGNRKRRGGGRKGCKGVGF